MLVVLGPKTHVNRLEGGHGYGEEGSADVVERSSTCSNKSAKKAR